MSKSQISHMENWILGRPETISRVLNALDYEVRLELIDRRSIISLKTDAVLDIFRKDVIYV